MSVLSLSAKECFAQSSVNAIYQNTPKYCLLKRENSRHKQIKTNQRACCTHSVCLRQLGVDSLGLTRIGKPQFDHTGDPPGDHKRGPHETLIWVTTSDPTWDCTPPFCVGSVSTMGVGGGFDMITTGVK